MHNIRLRRSQLRSSLCAILTSWGSLSKYSGAFGASDIMGELQWSVKLSDITPQEKYYCAYSYVCESIIYGFRVEGIMQIGSSTVVSANVCCFFFLYFDMIRRLNVLVGTISI